MLIDVKNIKNISILINFKDIEYSKGLFKKPLAEINITILGKKNINKQIVKTIKLLIINNPDINLLLSSCLSSLRNLTKVGTKATDKAPPAKGFFKIFGILKAAEKASETAPTPKNLTIKISFIIDNILLIKDNNPIFKLFFKIDFLLDIFFFKF